jgi:hypothetical protein
MDRIVPKAEQRSLLGPAGTALAVDTASCFHYGSRITKPDHRRIAAVFVYCPPSSNILPRRLAAGSAPLAHLVDRAKTPLARAVLGVAGCAPT